MLKLAATIYPRMRKRLTISLMTASGSLSLLGGIAVAAQPQAGKTYSGTGQEYENNGPHFETYKGFRQHMTLTVSANGSRVKSFTGHFSYYCGAGTGTVLGTELKIGSTGRFGGKGSKPDYYHGKRVGKEYVVLRGQFIDGGKKAAVTYQAAYVGTTQSDPHPYSLHYQSGGESCQNQVRGTIPVK